jgi:glycosyltransferase involved in cell wall biosynthesis
MKRESNAPTVTVCVCTYKRPELLAALLDSLAAQTFTYNRFEVVVVDNDKEQTAQAVIDRFRDTHPQISLRYESEARQGISFARNRTVALANGDRLAFIDDDETASPCWLEELSRVLEEGAFDAVLGPVLPVYSEETPDWIRKSRFFERRRHADGAVIDSDNGRTGNAMVKAAIAKSRQPHTFDPLLALSGGEDHDFFKWIETQGGRLGWADRAIVQETVPTSRQSLSFMLERSLRQSTAYWRGRYAAAPPMFGCLQALKGLAGACVFGLLGGVAFVRGRDRAARYWVLGAKGLGRVLAMSKVHLKGY